MPTVRTPVDAELIVVNYLRSALGGSTPVSTALPSEPSWPRVTINRTGGLVEGPGAYLDVARLQVDAWAATKAAASQLARNALAALINMPTAQAGAVVCYVEQDVGLRWEPDETEDPPQPRYVFGVAVYTHSTD